jgi:hypothetical protein
MEIESAETPLDVGIEENRPVLETGAEDADPSASTTKSEKVTPSPISTWGAADVAPGRGAPADVAPGRGAPAALAVVAGTKECPGKYSCQKTLPSIP